MRLDNLAQAALTLSVVALAIGLLVGTAWTYATFLLRLFGVFAG